jgi:hypothetical protein
MSCLGFSHLWMEHFATFFHVHFLTRLLHSDGVGGEQSATNAICFRCEFMRSWTRILSIDSCTGLGVETWTCPCLLFNSVSRQYVEYMRRQYMK